MRRRDFLMLSAAAGIPAPFFGTRASASLPAGEIRKRLIVVSLRGGLDGLSAVVPHAESAYYRLRPAIAIPRPGEPGGALDLDGHFGLHPALAPLVPLWRERSLAFVHASGLPGATHSHFAARDAMDAFLRGLSASAEHAGIRLDLIESGGWDTHAAQGGTEGYLAARLRELGQGLAALRAGLGTAYAQTLILVMSEFGRSAGENVMGGTDHGHGNALWMLGGSVEGGKLHGEWPGLGGAALHDGHALAAPNDIRGVIAAALARLADTVV
jgi:uncharacterized protein (DUF1501 family)